MIQSYRDKRTRDIAERRRVPAFQAIEQQAIRRLAFLDKAESLQDLMQLRSNRLESLGGNRAGQYSIRINDQWRVCFRWTPENDGPFDVEIVDYH